MDLRSVEAITIAPGQTYAVSTGLSIELPPGYEAQIRPRSGLAFKHSITIPNSPGTIDPSYRGEIKAILHNLGTQPFAIQIGDRIAQMVVAELPARMYFVTLDGFDTHAQQENGHAALMAELGDAIRAFERDLAGHGMADRVMLSTFSEFGRRVAENGTHGSTAGAECSC